MPTDAETWTPVLQFAFLLSFWLLGFLTMFAISRKAEEVAQRDAGRRLKPPEPFSPDLTEWE